MEPVATLSRRRKVNSLLEKADASITGGGCLIETKMGEIDARIDRQFKVIEDLFESEFEKTCREAE